MLGVIINSVAVAIGSLIGLIFKSKISEKISKPVMVGLGVCVLYIGISGSLEGENVLIAISSIVLGVIVGTILKIDDSRLRSKKCPITTKRIKINFRLSQR